MLIIHVDTLNMKWISYFRTSLKVDRMDIWNCTAVFCPHHGSVADTLSQSDGDGQKEHRLHQVFLIVGPSYPGSNAVDTN